MFQGTKKPAVIGSNTRSGLPATPRQPGPEPAAKKQKKGTPDRWPLAAAATDGLEDRVKVSHTIGQSFRCNLLQTSIEACPSIYHTCSMALKARKATSMTTKAMKAMKGMKAMKTTGVKVKKSKARKPKNKAMKKAMTAMKAKKVETQVQTTFEIVVSICRRCRSAQEIVGVQAPVLTLREYYCLQCASPVELHGLVIH